MIASPRIAYKPALPMHFDTFDKVFDIWCKAYVGLFL